MGRSAVLRTVTVLAVILLMLGPAWAGDGGLGDYAKDDGDTPNTDCQEPIEGEPPPSNGCPPPDEIELDGVEVRDCLFKKWIPPQGQPYVPTGSIEAFLDCIVGDINSNGDFVVTDTATGFTFERVDGQPVQSFCMRETHPDLPALTLELDHDTGDPYRVAKIRKLETNPSSGEIVFSINEGLKTQVPMGHPSLYRANRAIKVAIENAGFTVVETADYFIVTQDIGPSTGIHHIQYATGGAVNETEVALETYNLQNTTDCSP